LQLKNQLGGRAMLTIRKITLASGNKILRERLEKKLQEYKERIAGKGKPWEIENPELAHRFHPACRDAVYKVAVLEALLKSGEISDTQPLFEAMGKKFGDDFNSDQFDNACGVIASYCGNIPDVPIRGTGLPTLVMPKNTASG
jgi:hypothetical protein